MKALLALACALLLAAGTAVSAHHSFAAQYDVNKPLTLTGTVVSIEWTNPHIHFQIDVKDAKGTITQWRFEGYPPNMLVRQGWKRDVTLKPGDVVTVFAWQARVEPNLGMAREVTFADGRKMTSGPPAATGGQ
jgi:DNA/RNA endonuclease YhcR with UshA esterase domain